MAVIYTDIRRPPQSLVRSLAEFGVATLWEAGARRLLQPLRPVSPGQHIAGPAVIAYNGRNDNAALHLALETMRAGDVIVTGMEPGGQGALWGELVTVYARTVGAAGAVVDGAVRDWHYLRSDGFPVWASSISPAGTTKERPISVNGPAQIGGQYIEPGWIVVADDDGVVIIPPGEAEGIVMRARQRVEAEAAMTEELRLARSTASVMDLHSRLRTAGRCRFHDGAWPGGSMG